MLRRYSEWLSRLAELSHQDKRDHARQRLDDARSAHRRPRRFQRDVVYEVRVRATRGCGVRAGR